MQQSCPATSPLSCLQLAKPSGRPGHGRPGRWRSVYQSVPCLTPVPASSSPASSLRIREVLHLKVIPGITATKPGFLRQCPSQSPACQPHPARFRPHQRRSGVLLFEGLCLFAFTLVTRSTICAALTPLGRSGPGRGGRLPTHSAGLFRCSREPGVSLPRRSRARRPPLQDRLPGHAPLRSAPLVTGRLAGGSRIKVRGNAGDISRIDLPACKTPSNQGPPETHARTPVPHRPTSPARRPEKRYK